MNEEEKDILTNSEEETNSEEQKSPKKEERETENLKLEFPIDGDLNANCTLHRTTITKDKIKEYTICAEIELTREEKMQFHWGLFRYPKVSNWVAPSESYYPKEKTEPCDKNSANTNFINKKIRFELNLSSLDKDLFHGISFVFHNLSNEHWYNNHGSNYRLELIPRQKKKVQDSSQIIIPDCIEDGMDCEANACSWCLMFRYQKITDSIFQLDLEDPNEAVWVYLWLRYSFKIIGLAKTI